MAKRLTTEEFIKRAMEIHGDRYFYDETVYVNANTSVIIRCREHGKFSQVARAHIVNGSGCPMCAIESNKNRWRSILEEGKFKFPRHLTNAEFVKKAQLRHRDEIYSYEQVKYINKRTPVQIYCKIHECLFWQRPANHLLGRGCPLCSKEKIRNTHTKSKQEFLSRAEEAHPEHWYDYSLAEYINFSTKINIRCRRCNNIFAQAPSEHVQGRGCPFCWRGFSCSENLVKKFLDKKKIEYAQQKTFVDCINPETRRKLKYDYYIPELKLLVEYDGELHYEAREHFGGAKTLELVRFRDKIKNDYASLNDINLLRVPFFDKNKMEEILEKQIQSIRDENNLSHAFIVYCGPMWSKKTSKLIYFYRRAREIGKRVACFKPLKDDRYSQENVVSHNKDEIPATTIEDPLEIWDKVFEGSDGHTKRFDVILIDEAFMLPGIAEVCKQLFWRGFTVIVSTLDLAYNLEPFEESMKLMAWATKVEKCHAFCEICGSPAYYSMRTSEDHELVSIGGKDKYSPRCLTHFSLERGEE